MPKRDISGFIAHWSAASPSERGNSQAFRLDLCDLLEVLAPDNPFIGTARMREALGGS